MTTIQSRLPAFSHEDIWALPAMSPAYETLMRLCDVGKTTVAQMIKEGTAPIPVIPVGRQLRVRKIDVLNFLGLQDQAAAEVESAASAEENGDAPGVEPGAPVERNAIPTSK